MRDLSLRGIVDKALHAITSIDARTLRSSVKLLSRPGELTLAWTKGIRKPYVAPFPLVFIRERRPFMTHMAFLLHLYTFFLLLFCVALLMAKLSRLLGFGGLEKPMVDNLLSVANFSACAVYIYLAIGPVYDATGKLRGESVSAGRGRHRTGVPIRDFPDYPVWNVNLARRDGL